MNFNSIFLDKYLPNISAKDAILKGDIVIDENSQYRIDNHSAARGLFNKSNTKMFLTGEELLKIIEKDTLLRKGQYLFLTKGTITIKDLLALESDKPSIIDEWYKLQVDAPRYGYSRPNGIFSLKIGSGIVREWIENQKLPEHLKNWINEADWRKLLKDRIDKVKLVCSNVDENRFVYEPYRNALQRLKSNLRSVEFKVYHGYAGSGKSTAVINELKNADGKKAIVSLSNTIGLMFSEKLAKNGVMINNQSCSKCRYLYANEGEIKNLKDLIRGYEQVVIDEFSQWGFYELHLLNSIIEHNPKAKFYIMGDINQIPTFLSGGSLLYSIMEEFPDNVKNFTEMHRFTGELKTNITNLLKSKLSFNIRTDVKDILATSDIVVTGSNKHVKKFNELMFKVKHNINFSEDLTVEGALHKAKDEWIPLLANATCVIDDKYKMYTNQKFSGKYCSKTHRYCLRDEINNYTIETSDRKNLWKFNLGYAITVNKAQGLEWDNVAVYLDVTGTQPGEKDMNLLNFNALYVALSRGRHNVILSSKGEKLEENRQQISNALRNKKYKFSNHFSE